MMEMEKISKDLIRWDLKVPHVLDEQVKRAIDQGLYASKSELVRDAVRKILESWKEKPKPMNETRSREKA
jgi:Arc/MetJ-type ribon-helix-helix transcriptional regulator